MLLSSRHLPFQYSKKKAKRSGLSKTCHKCLSRMKGRHRGCASVKRQEEHIARVRGMKGVYVCRYGKNYACVQAEIYWITRMLSRLLRA